jgi:hypothetical protein
VNYLLRSGLVLLVTSVLIAPAYAGAQTPAAAGSPAAAAAPAASATPATADPKIEALAKDLMHRAQTNTFDKTQLTDQMSTGLTAELTKTLASRLGPLGEPSSFIYAGSQPTDGVTAYGFLVTFSSMKVKEIFAVDATGKVAGLSFSPVQ